MNRLFHGLIWFTQLGLSIITPIIICVFAGSWLAERFSLGNWVMLLSIGLGLGAAGMNAYGFYKYIKKRGI